MAEIRKHHPKSSLIADAVRAAMGETVRPRMPGEEPHPDSTSSTRSLETSQDLTVTQENTFEEEKITLGLVESSEDFDPFAPTETGTKVDQISPATWSVAAAGGQLISVSATQLAKTRSRQTKNDADAGELIDWDEKL